MSPSAWFAFLLPWLRTTEQGLSNRITPKLDILWQILWASLILFVLAHLLLFRLYLPSRYTYFSVRFILPIAAGIVLTLLLEKSWLWFNSIRERRYQPTPLQMTIAGFSLCLGLALIVVPWVTSVQLSNQNWFIAWEPELYQFIAKQPKNTMVVSLSRYANNIPSFSERSTLINRETSVAVHLGYYQVIQERVIALNSAQFCSI